MHLQCSSHYPHQFFHVPTCLDFPSLRNNDTRVQRKRLQSSTQYMLDDYVFHCSNQNKNRPLPSANQLLPPLCQHAHYYTESHREQIQLNAPQSHGTILCPVQ